MTQVHHPQHGNGTLLSIGADGLAVVRFPGQGLIEVPDVELTELDLAASDAPLPTLLRLQAFAIQSVQQRWGAFSTSRIKLLPHQLWTCQKVMASWPPRWLIADDVGMGKTVEAGLILQAAKAQGRLQRLLILCPASLVWQWQSRLKSMFSIRCDSYDPKQDTPTSGFWEDETRRVVASFHSLRQDRGERWARLMAAEPWDLVIFDEAHHLGSDEQGLTLAYRLLDELERAGKTRGLLLFTGTPHKGEDFGFLNLLRLLYPRDFNPRQRTEEQYDRLPAVMIRNSKARATDLQGNRLFHGTRVHSHEYTYSEPEKAFYNQLTAFISQGLLFARSLDETNSRAVGLVLASLQKLAASSVAAVERAIQNRLTNLRGNQQRKESLEMALELDHWSEDDDARATREADLAKLSAKIALVENEEPFLLKLLTLSSRVREESKIHFLVDLVRREFVGKSVLFFTEYKATQALLMSALNQAFTEDIGFINGDEAIEGVVLADGMSTRIVRIREEEARKFNEGNYRFLVSTEAAGEGIDLQGCCHTLIHVDLPWNPMRMHQRVGRLYRYGQQHPVEVHKVYNPDAIESHIHNLLEKKLHTISQAFSHLQGDEDQEDLLQIVLGMAKPGTFDRLFQEGAAKPTGELDAWVDEASASFISQEAFAAAQTLLGHGCHFDFEGAGKEIPKVDLPALKPFFRAALWVRHREWTEAPDTGRGGFITPESWREDRRLRPRYDGISFERNVGPKDHIMGADDPLFRRCLDEALTHQGTFVDLPTGLIADPILIFRVHQRTHRESAPPDRVFAIQRTGSEWVVLRDWEMLNALNPMLDQHRSLRDIQGGQLDKEAQAQRDQLCESGKAFFTNWLERNDQGLQHPGIELLGVLTQGLAQQPNPGEQRETS
ncbi:DEAD/DEAH box helicase [Holophaga foetida]|uniref:DEAD/DEAH box helicase n=1 Tax=Holophaga foetida TaxID=35839 RepID=UPI0002471C20|nr:helicase-related protein [Holophaga foetida]